jgi:hypothetical protein
MNLPSPKPPSSSCTPSPLRLAHTPLANEGGDMVRPEPKFLALTPSARPRGRRVSNSSLSKRAGPVVAESGADSEGHGWRSTRLVRVRILPCSAARASFGPWTDTTARIAPTYSGGRSCSIAPASTRFFYHV